MGAYSNRNENQDYLPDKQKKGGPEPNLTPTNTLSGQDKGNIEMPILRPYQEEFIDKVISKLADFRKVVAVAPTGFGKTIVSGKVTHRFIVKFTDQRVLIMAHRMELLSQIEKALKLFGIHQFLIQAGIKEIPESRVYVAMVETMARRPLPSNIGLMIVDEAHTGNFRKIIEKFEGKIIGFTATPISSKIRIPLKDHFEAIVTGAAVPDLIQWGYLASPILYSPKGLINKKDLEVKAGEYSDFSQFRQLSNIKFIKKAIDLYKAHANGKKTIFFNCNVEHNNLMASTLTALGYFVLSVDGKTEPEERKAIFKKFKETPGAILCNVNIATTGFDEPTVQCIVLNFATKSLTKYIQCIGRGSRIDEATGKKEFVILDLCENYLEHGLWEYPRNWERIFKYPKKYTEGESPTRVCMNPDCNAIIHLASTKCKHCGFEMPRSNSYDSVIGQEELLNYYTPNHGTLMGAYIFWEVRSNREICPFYKVLEIILRDLKKLGIKQVTELVIDTIWEKMHPYSLMYCRKINQNLSSQKNKLKWIIKNEAQKVFKGEFRRALS